MWYMGSITQRKSSRKPTSAKNLFIPTFYSLRERNIKRKRTQIRITAFKLVSKRIAPYICVHVNSSLWWSKWWNTSIKLFSYLLIHNFRTFQINLGINLFSEQSSRRCSERWIDSESRSWNCKSKNSKEGLHFKKYCGNIVIGTNKIVINYDTWIFSLEESIKWSSSHSFQVS